MLTLFGLTAVLLLAPKVLSLVAIVVRGEARRFGGAARLLASALIEFVHSLLLAPVRMLFHTQFVLAALTGWRLDWKSPPRDDASTPWREAAARHGVHTVLAIAWIAAIVATSAAFPWWLSPILAGLLLGDPALGLHAAGSRDRPRAAPPWPDADARRKPRAARAARGAPRRRRRSPSAWRRLRAAIVDRGVQRRVVAALPPRCAAERRQGRGRSSARSSGRCATGPARSAADDGLRLLSSRSALARCAAKSSRGRAHPDWGQAHDDGVDADDVPTAPMPARRDAGDAAIGRRREHATESL